jgi:hypothetical protein
MNHLKKSWTIFQNSWANFQKNHEQNFETLEHFLKKHIPFFKNHEPEFEFMNNFPKSLNFLQKSWIFLKHEHFLKLWKIYKKEVDKANRKIKTGKENMKEKKNSDENK